MFHTQVYTRVSSAVLCVGHFGRVCGGSSSTLILYCFDSKTTKTHNTKKCLHFGATRLQLASGNLCLCVFTGHTDWLFSLFCLFRYPVQWLAWRYVPTRTMTTRRWRRSSLWAWASTCPLRSCTSSSSRWCRCCACVCSAHSWPLPSRFCYLSSP